MRLICPNCAAVYEVPFESLKPGRRTRCARCKAMWMPLQDDEAAAEASPPEPVAEEPPPAPVPARSPSGGETAMDRLAALPRSRPSMALRAAWATSFALLAGSAVAAYVWRGPAVQAWPPSGWVLGSNPVSPSAKAPAPPTH